MNEDFFDTTVERAKKILMEGLQMFPSFIAHTKKDKFFILMTPWENDRQKDAAVNYIRLLFIKEEVYEYCFSTEMWFVKVDKLEDRPKGPICDLPDKQEGLVIVHGTIEEGEPVTKSAIFEIVRGTNGIELKDYADMKIDNRDSTFANMLASRSDVPQDLSDEINRLLPLCEKYLGFKIRREDM